MVRAIKNLQALYNTGATKFVKHYKQGKATIENMNFLIYLAFIILVAEDTKLTVKEPQTFNKT